MRQLEYCEPLKKVLIGVEPRPQKLCYGCIIYERNIATSCPNCYLDDHQKNIFKPLKRKEI